MKRIVINLALLMLLLLSSCEENIVIKLNDYEGQLSVECILEPDKVPILYLGKTVEFFDSLTSNQDLFVNDALVMISSEGIIDTLTIASKFNYYRCQEVFYYLGSIPVIQGKMYNLRIEYAGEIFTADTETNVPAIQIKSISYTESFTDFYGEHEGVVVSFIDMLNVKNFYRYRMDRILDVSQEEISNCTTGPYPATEIGRTVYFDSNIDGTTMTIVIEPVFDHEEGDSALVYLQTLNAASARFYDDLDQQKNSKLNPFVEPIFITSNISGAFGIFGARNYSNPVEFIYPD